MYSISKNVFLILIATVFLYAPTDIIDEKTNPKSTEESATKLEENKDGRVWLDAARGWVESGTNFYPYSTGLNVGIGTMTPAYRLDITGSMRVTGGIHDGIGFGNINDVLVADGLGGVQWSPAPGGSNAYIWNQFSSAQNPASFWIAGQGKIIHSSPGTSDTALTAITYEPGRRGIYGECASSDGSGVGITGVGGFFGAASWYGPSGGSVGGVLGTYYGEGVWGLSDVNYGGWTGVYGEGRGSGMIGVYGQSAGAVQYLPPAGQDAGLFAAGRYYGLYGMGQQTASYGIGVVGLGDSVTTITYIDGAGVVGCGAVGVLGAINGSTYGALGYSVTRAGYFYHSQDPLNGVGQSTIYAYRTRTSQNNGTGYGTTATNEAIEGYSYWGDIYTFGVSGHNYNDYTRCGGVLGANVSGTYWGSLGYKNSGSSTYGGYFTSTGSGGGFLGMKSGIGYGAYGDLLGGWVKGEEYGLHVSGKRYALYLDGNTYTSGYIATLHYVENKLSALYTLTSTGVSIMSFGKGRLSSGLATVTFSEGFSSAASDIIPITVIITPIGDCNTICLSEVTGHGFSVRENNKGVSNSEFNWVAIGIRKGYEETDIPREIMKRDYDENMVKVALNENELDKSAQGMWFDGQSLRFGTIPSAPVIKDQEDGVSTKEAELRELEEKLRELKKHIKGLEQEIERINIQSTSK